MQPSPLSGTSRAFGVRIINLHKFLTVKKRERALGTQLLRCGTSIGANAWEATCSFSRREFSAKMAIALKEAKETEYWLLLLRDAGYLDLRAFDSIMTDCQELISMLVPTVKKTKDP